MRVWLSIDWDFFVRELGAWEWGHAESTFFRDGMWPIREGQFLGQDRSLREEMDPNKHSEPTPAEFWKMLSRHGYDFTGAKIVVADSHRFGADNFIHNAGSADGRRLVHFDAHHDLGYSVPLVTQHIKNNEADCADWHLMTLRHFTELRSLIVYPAWKGLHEWTHSFGRVAKKKAPANDDFRKRVKAVVYPDPAVEEYAGDVDAVFICRSGSWAPPWLDEMFREFVADLSVYSGTEPQTPYVEYESCDPLVAREYDARGAEGYAKIARMTPEDLFNELAAAKEKMEKK